MQVSFKYSQEDLVGATVRFAARSKTLRGIRRRQLQRFIEAANTYLNQTPAVNSIQK
jgi:hypothetical protein